MVELSSINYISNKELHDRLLLLKLENNYSFKTISTIISVDRLSDNNIIEIIKFDKSFLKDIIKSIKLNYKCKDYILQHKLQIEDLIFYQSIEDDLYFKYKKLFYKYIHDYIVYQQSSLVVLKDIMSYIKENKSNKIKILFLDIVKYQELSEELIYQYRNDLNWEIVCRCQNLSEQFIETNLSYINWNTICYQKLSLNFIKKYIDKFSSDALEKIYYKGSRSIKKFLKDKKAF